VCVRIEQDVFGMGCQSERRVITVNPDEVTFSRGEGGGGFIDDSEAARVAELKPT
jgi:hypothetical protein